MEMNAVTKENSDLKRTVEKRQLESRKADKDVEEIREKVVNNTNITKYTKRNKTDILYNIYRQYEILAVSLAGSKL